MEATGQSETTTHGWTCEREPHQETPKAPTPWTPRHAPGAGAGSRCKQMGAPSVHDLHLVFLSILYDVTHPEMMKGGFEWRRTLKIRHGDLAGLITATYSEGERELPIGLAGGVQADVIPLPALVTPALALRGHRRDTHTTSVRGGAAGEAGMAAGGRGMCVAKDSSSLLLRQGGHLY